jgi:O-antigen/teichoic acid export membrane protein
VSGRRSRTRARNRKKSRDSGRLATANRRALRFFPAEAESKVIRNFLALGGGEIVSRLIAFGAYVYLARVLGAEGYGAIAFVTGIHLYLTKIADFGIESVGASHVAQNPAGISGFAPAILAMRLALTCGVIGFSAGVAQWLLSDPERTVMQLYLFTLLPIAANTKWVHLGLQNALPVGLARILGESIFLGTVIGLVRHLGDLWTIPLGAFAGEASAAALLYILLARRSLGFGLRWDPAAALPVFRRAAPLVAQIMLGLVIYNSDLVFLRILRDGETVGYYAAAYMLLSFLGNVAVSYAMSLIPAMARHQGGSAQELALYHASLAQVYALTLPLAVGGCLIASEIIALWFGPGYEPAGDILALLIWALPATSLRNPPWAALVARGRQSLLLRATVFAALANIALNLALITPFGMVGAALATIATESIAAFLMLHYSAREGLGFLTPRRLLAPTVGSLAMAGALIAVDETSILIRIPLGMAVYAVVMTLMGAIRFDGRRPGLRV